jgi:hypothetical protein
VAWSASDSAIKVTDDIRQALEQASSPEAMKDLLHEQAVAQGLATRDAIDSTVLLPTELASRQPTRFAEQRTETIEQSTEQPRDEAGRFVSPNDAAVEEYLQTRGIDPTALQEVSEKKYQDSWREATDAFLANHPDWQGGQENLKVIGEILVQSELEDAPDKLDALERAYVHALENGWLTENPELVQLRAVSEANDHESIRRLLSRDPFAVRN